MQTYELVVEGRTIRPNGNDNTLVRTSVGMDRVHVLFDSNEWVSFPITATFSQEGVRPVTTSMTVTSVSNSSKWAAQGTVDVPYEAITRVGPIRVTFQGTNSGGNHIITAFGEPLMVEEAGDVEIGDMPGDAPTIDQWTQAYADAVAAINNAQTVIDNLQQALDDMVAGAESSLDDQIEAAFVPATTSTLGMIKVGEGLEVDVDGMLHATQVNGITDEQAMQISNLALLADYCFDTNFGEDGYLLDDAKAKASAIPVDGTTIAVNDDGLLTVAVLDGDGELY